MILNYHIRLLGERILEIAFIVPCYNEAKRLKFELFKQYNLENPHVHFFFVNDGSTDNTLSILKENFSEKYIINMPQNSGKAEAVRYGMQNVSSNKEFSYIGFLDADLATPLSELSCFIAKAKKGKKAIMGARILRLGSDIKRKWYRHYFGRCFATCASLLLRLPVYDTQCGAKLFEREAVFKVTKSPFVSKWIFDVEFILRLMQITNLKQEDFYEIPLGAWEDISGSHLKVTDFLKAPFELLQLILKYKI